MVTASPPDATTVARDLLDWYDRARRDLPWRAPPGKRADPYAVWLSEIMLQQTTVAAVKPYFGKFLARWPDVRALAAADQADVLAAWAGLGYYSRARNLHACAGKVVARFGGRFPQAESDLLSLPGIGVYTAAAIAAIAHGQRAVVIDGNVERVIARYRAITAPLPGARPLIRAAAAALTPDTRPGDYAQAMMDLGATVCTPTKPACHACPLLPGCAARQRDLADQLPAKAAKAARPVRRGAAFVIANASGDLVVRTRAENGLLGGMTEVPTTDWRIDAALPQQPAGAPLPADWRFAGAIVHVFTHFRLELAVFAASVANATPLPPGCRWLASAAVADAAFPTVMRKVLARASGG